MTRVRELLAARKTSDRDAAYRAHRELMSMAANPVDWSYEIWDEMVRMLGDRAGHQRAFAAQMLAHLAISDPEERMLDDFAALAAVLRDEKTVTSRHTLQSIWRVGLAGPEQRAMVLEALTRRFEECATEKNGSLVRTDTITALGKLAQETGDPAIPELAEKLMSSEEDEKARKKQRASWRRPSRGAVAHR